MTERRTQSLLRWVTYYDPTPFVALYFFTRLHVGNSVVVFGSTRCCSGLMCDKTICTERGHYNCY